MKKERNWKRCSKKIVCVLLTASMLFTNAGMSVFAQEDMRTEESEECLEIQETEEDLETETTKEETATETFAVEEPEETEVLSKGASSENSESDEQETGEQEKTTVQTSTESVDEEKSMEEDLEDEESDTEITQALEDNADASDKSGTSGDITWSIDENGKLTVEGTGDFKKKNDYQIPWYEFREDIITAEVKVQGMTDASWMFSECRNLTDVDLSKFDTSSVTNMRGMFTSCRSLTSLNLSSFNTENVTDMNQMFWSCNSLTSLDLSSFNVENVTVMEGMFQYCNALTTINTPCNVLISLNVELPSGDEEGNQYYSYAWYDEEGNAYGYLPKGLSESVLLEKKKFEDIQWSIDGNGHLTVKGKGNFPHNRAPWSASNWHIKTAEIDIQGMTDASYMFSGCYNLTSIDFKTFDTENITNMSSMFSNCESLTSVDISGFDTGNVTDMSSMFSNCRSLTSVAVSGFDTGNVTDMSQCH